MSFFSLIRNGKALFGGPKGDRKEMKAGVLDGLRIIATLWVISFHIFDLVRLLPGGMDVLNEIYPLSQYNVFQNGSLGVDMFFVISGFLMMCILYEEYEYATNKKENWAVVGRFYMRRILRIYPSYMLALGLWCALVASIPSEITSYQFQLCQQYWWTNILMISNFYPGGTDVECMAWTWSISVEMQMYMISPLVVYVAYKAQKITRILSFSWLIILTLLSAGLYIGYSLYYFINDVDGRNYVSYVYTFTYMRFFGYSSGMIAALQVMHERKGMSGPMNLIVRGIVRIITTGLVIAIGVYGGIFYYPDIPDMIFWQIGANRVMFSFSFAFVIYDLIVGVTPDRGWKYRILDMWIPISRKLLNNRVTYIFAQFTYNIYLYHLQIICIFYVVVFQTPDFIFEPNWMIITFTIGCFLISSVIALVVYFLIEKPFINMGKMKKQSVLVEFIELNEKDSPVTSRS